MGIGKRIEDLHQAALDLGKHPTMVIMSKTTHALLDAEFSGEMYAYNGPSAAMIDGQLVMVPNYPIIRGRISSIMTDYGQLDILLADVDDDTITLAWVAR